MRLTELRHQDRAVSIIRRAMRSGRTHHAYLFHGPDGVGKQTAATALAARLLCGADGLESDADACGECSSCRLLARGNHPDFHLIHRRLHKDHPDPAVRRSKGLFLAVDVVRHFLIDKSALKPMQGAARVFLIAEAERMNPGAQNALLKTLEEPPGETRLILVTTSASRLLPTIRSRCQHVPFNPLPPDFVEQRLRSLAGIDAQTAHSLARLSDGQLGSALHWHRLELPAVLNDVAGLLGALADGDIEAFGKRMEAIAETLAKRTVALESDDDPSFETDVDASYTADANASSAGEPDEDAADSTSDAPATPPATVAAVEPPKPDTAGGQGSLFDALPAPGPKSKPSPSPKSSARHEAASSSTRGAAAPTAPPAAARSKRPAARSKRTPAGRRSPAAASRAVQTDDTRAAMKLLFKLIAALFRDALVVASGGDRKLIAAPQHETLTRTLAGGEFTADPQDCIRAVAVAEAMLDRNVNTRLTCERLASALTGVVPVDL